MPLTPSQAPGAPLGWQPADPNLADAARAGDLTALNTLVAREAMPPEVVHELARQGARVHPEEAYRRAAGRLPTDPRLRRRLPPRPGRRSEPWRTVATLPEGQQFVHAAPLGDGIVVRDTGGTLAFADTRGLRALPTRTADALPHPLDPNEHRALAIARAGDQFEAWTLSADGDEGIRWRGPSVGHPTAWVEAGEHLTVFGSKGATLVPRHAPAVHLPATWPYPPQPRRVAGGGVLFATSGTSGQEAVWLDPRGPSIQALGPIPGVVTGLAMMDETAWVTTHEGLFRMPLEGPPTVVAAGAWFGLLEVHGGLLAYGEQGAYRLPEVQPITTGRVQAFGAWAVGDLLLWSGSRTWWLTDADGREITRARDTGDVTTARLGTRTAVLCGTDLAILEPDGCISGRARLETEGALYGATAKTVVVGPHRGGRWRHPTSGWWAFGHDAGLVSCLAIAGHRWPSGTASQQGPGLDAGLITPGAVWALLRRDLVRWDPDPEHDEMPAPAPRPPRHEHGLVHRGSCVGGHPTDAVPDPGALVDGVDSVLVDCTLAGSSYPAPAPDLEVERGGVVVARRLRLEGTGALRVGPESTAILVDATVAPTRPRAPWSVEAGGHLVVFGGSGMDDISITLGPGATLEIDGRSVATGPCEVPRLAAVRPSGEPGTGHA